MTKYTFPAFVSAAILLLSSASAPESSNAPVELFNGKDLSGWSHFLVDDAVSRDAVWRVEDGILICKGTPLGYLYTDTAYRDFRLTVEWRWAPGQEPGNSGILLRIHGKAVSFLPRCVECQLKHGSAGDLWAFHGAAIAGDPDRSTVVLNHEKLSDFKGVQKIQAAEKAAGEWNHCEIEVRGRNVTVDLNGQRVNEARELDYLGGPIGLQSEGGEIHFRTVRILPL
jgi:hypothetical protein